jgi:hypothetical protein
VNWALKNELGLARVINDAALYGTLYWVLSWGWKPINRAVGWYLIPVGQSSLYVFIMHVFVVLLANQLVLFSLTSIDWMINTMVHAGSLLVLWLMVKYKFLGKIVPN